MLGIRSKTRITAEVLRRASRLVAIGAYCIGTEQIDLDACNDRGVVVFNAPYSNTRSVVELALGEMILLLRGAYDSSVRLHGGAWNKTSTGFHEIRGKRLGIIGYGNIGSQLSVLAEAMGMEVCYYDIEEKLTLGNARKCSLEELLRTSDIVTVHVDGRDSNGSTSTSVNFPNIQPSGTRCLHRFAHIHKNIPGMLAKINELFARNGVNIAGQNLQTRGSIGYAVIDINGNVEQDIMDALGKIPHTIRSRVVY